MCMCVCARTYVRSTLTSLQDLCPLSSLLKSLKYQRFIVNFYTQLSSNHTFERMIHSVSYIGHSVSHPILHLRTPFYIFAPHSTSSHPILHLVSFSPPHRLTHTHIHSFSLSSVYTHIHKHTDRHIHTHRHTHTYTQTHTHTHRHIHTHTYTHTHTHTFFPFLDLASFSFPHNLSHTRTHRHTHTHPHPHHLYPFLHLASFFPPA